jgi:hypothetical protein
LVVSLPIGSTSRSLKRNEEIARIVAKRVDEADRPVIVEGATVLRLLAELKRQPDFTIYIANKDAPESRDSLLADLNAYYAEFSPNSRADLAIEFEHCD